MPRTETRVDELNSTTLYFNEIGKTLLLTAEEEVTLAQRLEAGRDAWNSALAEGRPLTHGEEGLYKDGLVARDQLITNNTKLVVSVAKRYINNGDGPPRDINELAQIGNLGLFRAVEKFDWRKGFKFSTYATWWIRQSIARELQRTNRYRNHTVSLDKFLEDSDSTLHEFVPDPDWASEEGLERTDGEVALQGVINIARTLLGERDYEMYLEHRGFFPGRERLSNEELAAKHGVHKVHVNRVNTKMKSAIHHPSAGLAAGRSDEFSWHARAECRGEDIKLFFPSVGERNNIAKAMCKVCTVKGNCLEYTEGRKLDGIWAETTVNSRKESREAAA